MPVLFTCPHGGRVELSPRRKKSNLPTSCNPDQFTTKSDLNTIELTEGLKYIQAVPKGVFIGELL